MANKVNTTGSCLCGAVKVEISGSPFRMAQCHCRDCQKTTGTGHISLAFFSDENVTISGESKGYTVTADSGNASTRIFCAECGSRVSGKNSARVGIAAVPVGILEDRSWFTPDAVVYCANRDDWDKTDTTIPNFDAMPPPA